MFNLFKLSSILVAVFALAACASSSNKVTVQESAKISKGQELNDLVRAKNAQAVTTEEYETLRQIILRRPH